MNNIIFTMNSSTRYITCYRTGKYIVLDIDQSNLNYTDWGPTGAGFNSVEEAANFAQSLIINIDER